MPNNKNILENKQNGNAYCIVSSSPLFYRRMIVFFFTPKRMLFFSVRELCIWYLIYCLIYLQSLWGSLHHFAFCWLYFLCMWFCVCIFTILGTIVKYKLATFCTISISICVCVYLSVFFSTINLKYVWKEEHFRWLVKRWCIFELWWESNYCQDTIFR